MLLCLFIKKRLISDEVREARAREVRRGVYLSVFNLSLRTAPVLSGGGGVGGVREHINL